MHFLKTDFSLMRRYTLLPAMVVLAATLGACATNPKPVPAPIVTEYKYPIDNPYAATIIGLPNELKKPVTPIEIKENSIKIFKDRKIPEGFWYEKELRYGTVLQDHAAPLIYILAGTGADHRAANMQSLGMTYYNAGYHVVLLPSSTHPNFIITASENFIPGRPPQAAQDMYRVMKMIDKKIAKQATVKDRFLTGYSLGGLDAAYTAKLDETEKALNFKKVLLINPPMNLYSSIQKIDKMLYQGLPGGINGIDAFIDTEMARLATASSSGDPLDFQNARLLIDAYTKYPVTDERLAAAIGLAFRLFSANMIFTSDVMAHTGYIYPRNVEYTTGTSMNNYLSVALRISLSDYFNDVYSKQYMAANPNLTRQNLIDQSGLAYLSDYISNNPKFGLITNADDVILAPGDLEQLKTLFGSRAKIFPNGGHLGNLTYAPVTSYMVQFMNEGSN